MKTWCDLSLNVCARVRCEVACVRERPACVLIRIRTPCARLLPIAAKYVKSGSPGERSWRIGRHYLKGKDEIGKSKKIRCLMHSQKIFQRAAD